MLLKDKVAIITGATRGIGRAIAEIFAENGALLVLNGTNKEALNKLQEDINLEGKKHHIVVGDVSNPRTAEQLVEKAMNQYNRVNILVNNAGISFRVPTEKISLSDWQRVLDVNLNGTFYVCKQVIPIMKKQKSGKIVNISSRGAKIPNLSVAPCYGASKAGINYLTRHLSLELGPFGINVNVVCPGPIETDMTRKWKDTDTKKAMKHIPLGRFGKPEEVAQVVLFLVSDLSNYITGEEIGINGGLMHPQGGYISEI